MSGQQRGFLMKFPSFAVTTLLITFICGSALCQAGSVLDIPSNTLLNQCAGCHMSADDGTLSRISEQRKTAEGWEMTITRMLMLHGLNQRGRDIPFTDKVMHKLVKYLADTQGLAPEESAPYRYLLEQDLNQQEKFDKELAIMCGRCHSSARFALQRRTKNEWVKLVHFHVGQYPSIEYSLYGRDRDWFAQAINEVVPQLAEMFPIETEAWRQWQKAKKANFEGRWVLSGHMAGKGQMVGTMRVERIGEDNYTIIMNGIFSNGQSISGKGKAVVYTGYDWRAQLTLDGEIYRQVLAADSSGKQFEGRMFLKDQVLQGMKISVVRADQSRILSVFPAYIQRGQDQTITIAGAGLFGDIQLPAGLSVTKMIARDENRIKLNVQADVGAATGYSSLSVGSVQLPRALVVYDQLDALRVEPAYGIARVGGNGGDTSKLNAEFRAVGVNYGADQLPDTEDDLQLGYMNDVKWSVSPWDAVAEQNEDVKFTGSIDGASGIFFPADAGPNPERKRSTNNIGNLRITATLQDADKEITGEGQLVVTVQRWNNPPLK